MTSLGSLSLSFTENPPYTICLDKIVGASHRFAREAVKIIEHFRVCRWQTPTIAKRYKTLKLIMEKFEHQYSKKFSEINYELKNSTSTTTR